MAMESLYKKIFFLKVILLMDIKIMGLKLKKTLSMKDNFIRIKNLDMEFIIGIMEKISILDSG
jgi:hypothetical protein